MIEKTIIKTVFRQKAKLFAFQDHSTQGELADIGLKAIQRKNRLANRIHPKERSRVIREIKLQKIQHLVSLPGMESFQAVDRNHLPHPHHTMQGFINQNATDDLSTDLDSIVDWQTPIKIKLVFLPDELT